MPDKREELHVAKRFLRAYNERHGTDYEAQPNGNENGGRHTVDVYATSPTHPTLRLQLTEREDLRQESLVLKRFAKRIKKLMVFGPMTNMRIARWVCEAVHRKERRYSDGEKRSLILIVFSYVGPLLAREAMDVFKHFEQSHFRGIYYVQLPDGSKLDLHEGQIVAIKDTEGYSGEVWT